MAGVTDTVFRRMIRGLGGCGLIMTEFTSAECITRNSARTSRYLFFEPDEHPITGQLFGADADVMGRAAGMVEELGFDIVDVNLGCPAKKVVKCGGSGLLRDLKGLEQVLRAVRAAAEGTIHSVTMITRKPPSGLEGAPYLVERGISLKDLKAPVKIFDGSARDGARGFPANVNVAAALSLAGIGADKTRLEIWADPALTRNTHRIEVEADTARFSMSIEGIPSDNPRTGKLVAPSTVAALRALVSELKIGS